jgi:hypothetical protein
MMRALKRLAHYSRIDTPTIVSFVLFPMGPEPRTTLHVNFAELRNRKFNFGEFHFHALG